MIYWELNILYLHKYAMWKINSLEKVIKTDQIVRFNPKDVRNVISNGRLFIIKDLNRWSL